MAKMKGKGIVLAGLLAGAASFLSKKENRDKLNEYINGAKGKATNYMDDEKANSQNAKSEVENQEASDVNSSYGFPLGEAKPSTQAINGNEMLGEGGTQQVINEFDENR